MSLECNICVSSLANGEVIVTKCGHLYHEVCILQWLRQSQTCPTCRVGMRRTSVKKVFVVPRNENIWENSAVSAEFNRLQAEVATLKATLETKEKEIADKAKELRTLRIGFDALAHQVNRNSVVVQRPIARTIGNTNITVRNNNNNNNNNRLFNTGMVNMATPNNGARFPINQRYAHIQSKIAPIWKN